VGSTHWFVRGLLLRMNQLRFVAQSSAMLTISLRSKAWIFSTSGLGKLPEGMISSVSARARTPTPVASQLPSLKSAGTGFGDGV
jgi:hypothetical protein